MHRNALVDDIGLPGIAPADLLTPISGEPAPRKRRNGEANKLQVKDRPVHEWYRFVLSYPPHVVREYIARFGVVTGNTVLDPFCGTGTTLVECKKAGIASVGVEVTPVACLASRTKTDWTPCPDGLLLHAQRIADAAFAELATGGLGDTSLVHLAKHGNAYLRTLDAERMRLLLTDSISPLPLHKTLVLLDCLARDRDDRFFDHESLALANVLVTQASNLHFGPEVGVGRPRVDAPVIEAWLSAVRAMSRDLRAVDCLPVASSLVHCGDARQVVNSLEPCSVDAVITSPPYPNEKDYTRTTRLESVLLGFISNRAELRSLKHKLVRSNTRGVYKGDDDDVWVASHPEIQRIASAIEARRVELGKTSGFERMYARVTKLYFGGMARHLADLRTVLRPGAKLAYVVGDQASYLRVMIRTGQILADIAESLGYEVIGIDLFRTRLSTATKEQLREEVLVLRWPGT